MNPQSLQGDVAFGSFLAKCSWKANRFGALFPRRREIGMPDARLLSVFLERGVVPRSEGDGNNNRPADDLSKYLVVHPDDLVFNKLRTWQGGFGVSRFDGIVSPAYFVCKPNSSFFPRFVDYLLRSHIYLAELTRISKWMPPSQFDIAWEDLRTLPILTPSIETQERICGFLDRETAEADALVAKYKRLIELLEEKRVALITQAVTKGLAPNAPLRNSGVEWIGHVPEHWNVTPLSQATSKITNGYVGPTRDILQSDGVRYLQSLHIKNGQIRFDDPYFVSEAWSSQHRKSILRENDLLIVQTGDIGQVAVVPPDFIGCNCHALIIASPREDVVLGKFLSLVLISAYGKAFLQSVQTGALHPHLNCGNVKYFKIPTPPLEEQFAILQSLEVSLERIRTLIRSSEQACKLLGEHRSALITAAVTGQIDVSTYRSKKHPVEVCA